MKWHMKNVLFQRNIFILSHSSAIVIIWIIKNAVNGKCLKWKIKYTPYFFFLKKIKNNSKDITLNKIIFISDSTYWI